MSTEKNFVDYFNQPITEKSKLIVATGYTKLKLCSVVKFNRKTIVVKDLDFKDGVPIRTTPENTIVVLEDDLTVLAIRKGIPL
jgi:hypothetical protein